MPQRWTSHPEFFPNDYAVQHGSAGKGVLVTACACPLPKLPCCTTLVMGKTQKKRLNLQNSLYKNSHGARPCTCLPVHLSCLQKSMSKILPTHQQPFTPGEFWEWLAEGGKVDQQACTRWKTLLSPFISCITEKGCPSAPKIGAQRPTLLPLSFSIPTSASP